MRLLHMSWILASLFLAPANAADDTPDSNTPAQPLMIGTWTIDQSCEPHFDFLQQAFDDARILAESAQATLEGALQPRPKNGKGIIKNWDRVAKAIKVIFSFLPDAKNGNQRTEEHWENVFRVFDRMVSGLQATETIRFGNLDPIIVCNDACWNWFDASAIDPTLPADVTEDNKMEQRYPDRFKDNKYVGAYYWNGRWDWRGQKYAAIPATSCGPDSTTLAETSPGLGMIQLCERLFSEDYKKRKTVPALQTIDIGHSLRDLYDVAATLVHEFAHWYGTKEGEGPDGALEFLPDHMCRNDEGKFIYKNINTGAEVPKSKKLKKPAEKGLKEKVTYGFKCLQNLSKFGGPKESTNTAEAYAFFSMMAYLKKWDWSEDAKARGVKYEQHPPS
ncbi:hypothetical protein EDB81DRAFT_49813 [Dactylonectria macrodidyma]|uniref:Uncharacterized protein n=1 Tax=Dactylonectria macrodidyma TaxID=307937 RepID=A0A9P9FWD4_9HYPO|nr:hypothetical protein EDB81DRAFT_49813 [Dactylonectria macrodidyma]